MIIKSIVLNNFRQFRGVHTIEFAQCGDKNLTLILGQNTSGKTTLVQAFLWCLFEKTNFKSKKDLMNKELVIEAKDSIGIVSVQIEISYKDRDYTILRKQYFDVIKDKVNKTELTMSYKESNGETQEVVGENNIKNKINDILPEDLSEYFFFAGEYLNEINDKKNVKDAVTGLIGLKAIKNVVDYFNPNTNKSVIGQLQASFDDGGEYNAKQCQKSLQEAKDILEKIKEMIEIQKNEKQKLEDLIEEKNKYLLANASIKEKANQKLQLESDIKKEESSLENAEKRLVKDFNTSPFKFFARSIYNKAKNIIAETKQDGIGIPEMHAISIDFILNRKSCICGCDLTNNQGACDKIAYERSLLPPAHIGTLVRTFNEYCIECVNVSYNYMSNLESDYKNIREINSQLDTFKQRLDTISNQIGNFGGDIGKVENELRDLKTSLKRCEDIILEKNGVESIKKKEIADLQKKFDEYMVKNERNYGIRKQLLYAKTIYNLFNDKYKIQEDNINKQINDSISKIFDTVYHGNRVVKVDDDYRINLYNKGDNGNYFTDLSSGLDTVKNFAFVLGLVDVARKISDKNRSNSSEIDMQSDEQNEIAIDAQPYPLVMDAPFSNIDDKHIENISSIITSIAEQVILVIMEKDWIHAEKTMGSKVGRIYKIMKNNNSDTSSKIEEMKHV
ncbi:MAG: AAA family ATPase [Firmicutes bacterium]|nr:AAA family ATPase [Bacillota bacterium]MCL1954118.1 AAA family ATPase [Bacillota bacterium]